MDNLETSLYGFVERIIGICKRREIGVKDLKSLAKEAEELKAVFSYAKRVTNEVSTRSIELSERVQSLDMQLKESQNFSSTEIQKRTVYESQLKATNDDLNKQASELLNVNNEKDAIIEKLNREIKNKDESYMLMKEQMEQMYLSHSMHEEQLFRLNEQYSADTAEKQANEEKYKKEIDELKQKMEDMEEGMYDPEAYYCLERDRCLMESTRLEEELQAMSQSNNKINIVLKTKIKENEDLKEMVEKLQKNTNKEEIERLRSEMDAMKQEKHKVEEEMEILKSKYSQIEQEKEDMDVNMQAKEKEWKEKEEEIKKKEEERDRAAKDTIEKLELAQKLHLKEIEELERRDTKDEKSDDDEIMEMEMEMNNKNSRIKELEEKVREMGEGMVVKEKEIASKNEELQREKEKVEAVIKQRMSGYEAEIKKKDDRISELEQKQYTGTENEALQKELEEKSEKVLLLEKELEESKEMICHQQEEVKKREEDAVKKQEQMHCATIEAVKQEKDVEVNKLIEEVGSLKIALEKRDSELKEMNDAMRSMKSDTVKATEAKNMEVERMKKDIQEREHIIAELKEEMKREKSKENTVDEEPRKKMEEEMRNLQNEMKKELNEREKQLQERTTRITSLESVIKEQQESASRLVEEIERMKQERNAIQPQVSEDKEDGDLLRILKSENANLHQRVMKYIQELNTMTKKNNHLENRMSIVKQSMLDKEDYITHLNAYLEEKSIEIGRLKAQL